MSVYVKCKKHILTVSFPLSRSKFHGNGLLAAKHREVYIARSVYETTAA